MMVTSVTPVNKRKSKVFLEEGFAFVLYRSEIERFHISEGKDLPDEACRQIAEEVLLPRAREKALYLLGSQGRTAAQMERRLLDEGYPTEIVGKVMEFLEEYRLIDDDAYVRNYLSMNSAGKSRRQLICELQQKGVEQGKIKQILEEEPPDEEKSAAKLVERKLKGRRQISYEEKGKLSAYLGRKGYSYDVIRRVLGNMMTENEDFREDGQEWL